MENIVVQTLASRVATGEAVALVSVISRSGSSPARCGALMLVDSNGPICGSVGGGNLERMAISQARECLAAGESRSVEYSLREESELKMSCGGTVCLFIKVFSAQPRLIIVGGGHVGFELYSLGLHQGYRVEIIDDRDSIAAKERFPEAAQILCGDPAEILTKHPLNGSCYVTIATHSHALDREALAAVANSGAGYIGMIGSSQKIKKTLKYLLDQGVSRETIRNLYTPMGLNVATIAPKEIAISIMAEILLVKNNGTSEHMKTVKNISV